MGTKKNEKDLRNHREKIRDDSSFSRRWLRHTGDRHRSRPLPSDSEEKSEFWTYDKAKFLAQPVYSRDFPPCKYCE